MLNTDTLLFLLYLSSEPTQCELTESVKATWTLYGGVRTHQLQGIQWDVNIRLTVSFMGHRMKTPTHTSFSYEVIRITAYRFEGSKTSGRKESSSNNCAFAHINPLGPLCYVLVTSPSDSNTSDPFSRRFEMFYPLWLLLNNRVFLYIPSRNKGRSIVDSLFVAKNVLYVFRCSVCLETTTLLHEDELPELLVEQMTLCKELDEIIRRIIVQSILCCLLYCSLTFCLSSDRCKYVNSMKIKI